MQTDLIETFLDLTETRSFNRTAERLGITQSTVSGRIRTLERSLGVRLFRRGRAGTDMTTAGLQFEPHARTLRLTWAEARAAVKESSAALTLRIGIQHDLLETGLADWIAAMREAIPETALYVEADYSTQMCREVAEGGLDLAFAFTPTANPDLHFESLGELGYRMVSTVAQTRDEVDPERYILPNYSPAFARTHASVLPLLSVRSVSSGQAAVVRGLLAALGGATYLPDDTVNALVASGTAYRVQNAPRIGQPVFSVMHLRNRHRAPFRRVVRLLGARLPQAGRT